MGDRRSNRKHAVFQVGVIWRERRQGRGVVLGGARRRGPLGPAHTEARGGVRPLGFRGQSIPGVGASQEDGPAMGLWPSPEVGVRGAGRQGDGDEVKVCWQVEVGAGVGGAGRALRVAVRTGVPGGIGRHR